MKPRKRRGSPDQEPDPEIQQEMARKRMMAAVRRRRGHHEPDSPARWLQYDPERMAAPTVVAKGKGFRGGDHPGVPSARRAGGRKQAGGTSIV
jgi:hypothetical protein